MSHVFDIHADGQHAMCKFSSISEIELTGSLGQTSYLILLNLASQSSLEYLSLH